MFEKVPDLPTRRMFFGSIFTIPVAYALSLKFVNIQYNEISVYEEYKRANRLTGRMLLYYGFFSFSGAGIAYLTRNKKFD